MVNTKVTIKRYGANGKMQRQLQIKLGQREVYHCNECSKSFNSELVLHAHKRTHSNSLRHKCKLCGHEFIHLSGLKGHLITHGKKSLSTSDLQQRESEARQRQQAVANSVQGRKRKAHKVSKVQLQQQSNSLTSNLESQELIACNMSSKIQPQQQHNHTTSYMSSEDLSVCNMTSNLQPYPYKAIASSRNTLDPGVRNMLEIQEEVPDKLRFQIEQIVAKTLQKEAVCKNRFACQLCDRSYSYKENLKRHENTKHFRNETFKCNQCEKKFTYISTLRRHQQTHNYKEKFSCAICDQKFQTPFTLSHHQKIHAGFKAHHCLLCGKRFRTRYELTRHEIAHSKERPYKCDLCDYAAKTMEGLKNHNVTHSNEKQFACTFCEKTFKHMGSLTRHQQQSHQHPEFMAVNSFLPFIKQEVEDGGKELPPLL